MNEQLTRGKFSRRDFLKLTGVGFTGAALVGVAGCGGASSQGSSGNGGSRTLLLGHGADPGNPRALAAERFAKMVKKGTGGKIKVQIQGSEQLGSDQEMIQSIQNGSLDITANSQGPLATVVPQVALLGLPFLFTSVQQAWPVLDGKIGNKLASLSKKKGLPVLAWWDNGLRDITDNPRSISTPDDVKGLKIRTPDDPMTIDIFKALGANPTPMDFGQVYTALRQGTIDGQENPIVNIWSSKLYEVQKYLSLTRHKYESTPFIVSPTTMSGLSKSDQKVLRNAATKARDYQRDQLVKQTQDQLKKIGTKMKVEKSVSTDAFRNATKSVYGKWRSKGYSDLVDGLQAAAKAQSS